MSEQTLTTDATGQSKALPKLAIVEVTAVGEGHSAAAARENAKDQAAKIRDSVDDVVDTDEYIRSIDFKVEDPNQQFNPDDQTLYRAVERLRVDCLPETASEIIIRATDAGGTVPTVQFELHRETRDKLQAEALTAAMERAREKGERIAAAEGLAITGVREITTKEVSTGMESLVDEAIGNDSDIQFSPDPVVITEAVEVVYELEAS